MSAKIAVHDHKGAAESVPLVIRFIDRMSAVLSVGAGLALVLMSINIIIDVAGRSLFRSPFMGTLELTSF